VLTADKVLVTVGTPCSLSAVGTTETYHARVTGSPDFIAFAAFDAGLIDIEPGASGSLRLRWATGENAGKSATLETIATGRDASVGGRCRA
jgi:3-oxoacyl-[acyl-carrier-protein] synthase II